MWKKIKGALWRRKTIKGKNVPGIIPTVVFVAVVIGLPYYAFFRDTSDPKTKAAEKAAAERSHLVIQPGQSLQAAQQFQKVEEKSKTQSQLQTSAVISEPTRTKQTPKTDARTEAEKKTDVILAQLTGKPVPDENAQNKNLDEEASSSIVDVLTNMGDGSSKAKKVGNAGVVSASKATNIPPPAGSTHQTPKAFAVTYTNPNLKKLAQDANEPVKKPTGFETKHFLPIGKRIPVYIMNSVESTDQASLIELAVAENVIFDHRIQIEFGKRIFVTGGGKVVRDRMYMTGGIILDSEGREGRLVGEIMDNDETVGVRGYWKSMVLPKLFPYINRFSALWLAAMQDRQTNPDSAGIGTLNTTTNDLMLKEASRAITDAGDSLQKAIDQRYEDYLCVPKGTKAYLRLTQACDLTMTEFGMTATQPQQPKVVAIAANDESKGTQKPQP